MAVVAHWGARLLWRVEGEELEAVGGLLMGEGSETV